MLVLLVQRVLKPDEMSDRRQQAPQGGAHLCLRPLLTRSLHERHIPSSFRAKPIRIAVIGPRKVAPEAGAPGGGIIR